MSPIVPLPYSAVSLTLTSGWYTVYVSQFGQGSSETAYSWFRSSMGQFHSSMDKVGMNEEVPALEVTALLLLLLEVPVDEGVVELPVVEVFVAPELAEVVLDWVERAKYVAAPAMTSMTTMTIALTVLVMALPFL